MKEGLASPAGPSSTPLARPRAFQAPSIRPSPPICRERPFCHADQPASPPVCLRPPSLPAPGMGICRRPAHNVRHAVLVVGRRCRRRISPPPRQVPQPIPHPSHTSPGLAESPAGIPPRHDNRIEPHRARAEKQARVFIAMRREPAFSPIPTPRPLPTQSPMGPQLASGPPRTPPFSG